MNIITVPLFHYFLFLYKERGKRGARSELEVRKSYAASKNTTTINFTAFLSLITYYFGND